ncbi:MAG: hypothetical protein RL194_578 [Pseudomonadota bacterium]|jgi:hypothetical protein
MKLDDEDTRNYQQRMFFENEEKKRTHVDGITIFIAVLAAIIVAWLIRDAYINWQTEKALKQLSLQLAISAEQSQKQLRQLQLQREYANAKAREKAQLEAKAKQQQELMIRAQKAAAIKNMGEKEKAWDLYYKPAAGCESSNLNRETIKCGNDYIRARKKFEDEWASKVASYGH